MRTRRISSRNSADLRMWRRTWELALRELRDEQFLSWLPIPHKTLGVAGETGAAKGPRVAEALALFRGSEERSDGRGYHLKPGRLLPCARQGNALRKL